LLATRTRLDVQPLTGVEPWNAPPIVHDTDPVGKVPKQGEMWAVNVTVCPTATGLALAVTVVVVFCAADAAVSNPIWVVINPAKKAAAKETTPPRRAIRRPETMVPRFP
jgi:hypothetical protein